jgi:hypothetical protein
MSFLSLSLSYVQDISYFNLMWNMIVLMLIHNFMKLILLLTHGSIKIVNMISMIIIF